MDQEFWDIEKVDLLNKSLDLKNAGYRLAQICVSQHFTLLYSFEKEGKLVSLRFGMDGAEPVESIGWLYPYAFLYENEMKDLFGLNILNMNLDFGGHFYKTSIKHPFDTPLGT